jgi:hypothetical protein
MLSVNVKHIYLHKSSIWNGMPFINIAQLFNICFNHSVMHNVCNLYLLFFFLYEVRSGWKLIYHLFSHSSSADRSFWRSFESVWFLTCLYSKLSSANKRSVEVETTSGRSLMYTRNNSGPNTVPCSTPESTSSFTDSHPSTSTCCVLEDKKVVIHCRVFQWLFKISALIWLSLWRNPSLFKSGDIPAGSCLLLFI